MVERLLKSYTKGYSKIIGDGAYDTKRVHKYLYNQKIKSVIPSKKGAVINKNKAYYTYRNTAVETINKDKNNRKEWKKKEGYDRRSLVETCMYRYKKTFGERHPFRKAIL